MKLLKSKTIKYPKFHKSSSFKIYFFNLHFATFVYHPASDENFLLQRHMVYLFNINECNFMNFFSACAFLNRPSYKPD